MLSKFQFFSLSLFRKYSVKRVDQTRLLHQRCQVIKTKETEGHSFFLSFIHSFIHSYYRTGTTSTPKDVSSSTMMMLTVWLPMVTRSKYPGTPASTSQLSPTLCVLEVKSDEASMSASVTFFLSADLNSAMERDSPVDTMLFVLRDDNSLVTFTDQRDFRGVSRTFNIKLTPFQLCSNY